MTDTTTPGGGRETFSSNVLGTRFAPDRDFFFPEMLQVELLFRPV